MSDGLKRRFPRLASARVVAGVLLGAFLGWVSVTHARSAEDDQLQLARQQAAKILLERQDEAGFWSTQYTGTTTFIDTRDEMNVFLNAMMIDLIKPVAEAAGLTAALDRTQRFLADQVEAGGLVRYHGRADGPTARRICIITPDTDDTALIWRTSPNAKKELMAEALATIAQFRRPDGLYKTWLASTDQYKCIDPGRDPNPADIGIQMNLYLTLAEQQPAEARALCDALQSRVNGDDIWVYYKIAPLVPLLRSADLRHAGCALPFSPTRFDTTIDGQEIWIRLVQQLQRIEAKTDTSAASAEALILLRQLAANNFALLSIAPPLLYHNDMTARVKRFYWSLDVGYALWIRAYLDIAPPRQN